MITIKKVGLLEVGVDFKVLQITARDLVKATVLILAQEIDR